MPFRLVAPHGREVPIVVEVPHAGTALPPDVADEVAVDASEVLRDADAWVDTLWREAPTRGATALYATFSRYVVDLNRDEDDVDAETVEGAARPAGQPRGVVWRESGAGRPVLRAPLTPDAFRARIARYFTPYHAALAATLRALHARHGRVLLLAAHSMPSSSRLGVVARRASVVPGTRGRSTAHGALIDVVDAHFSAAGLSVRHDEPYRGGATTVRWGRPTRGFHAIQIELNRALYMDERAMSLREQQAEWLRGLCTDLIPRLAERLDALGSSADDR
jgi:N-formylglutamate amidohydrolase